MPDQEHAIDKYRRGVETYDESNRFRRLRQHCVGLLDLKPEDVVLDAACGTGLNFPLIQAALGERGRLVGVDLSPDMLAIARKRVSQNGWENVSLVTSSLEEATIPEDLDAALFFLTHDVMRSPRAIENVLASLRPGGRVAVVGAKWAPRWALPVNLAVWYAARRYTTTFEGFTRPWSHLLRHIPDLKVEMHLFGAIYAASGVKE